MAAVAEHPIALHAAQNNPALQAFICECNPGAAKEADGHAGKEKVWIPIYS
ncbi:MAG: hypothetical protein IPI17_16955 [Nitrosomonas sp.]|nr:hypothetical protein [Nitrosomonas sp.]